MYPENLELYCKTKNLQDYTDKSNMPKANSIFWNSLN